MVASGETTGIFQLESAGMRRLARKLKPNKFSDIAAMVALYRPGPMQWIDEFIDAKVDPHRITYPHPDLKPILEETYGTPKPGRKRPPLESLIETILSQNTTDVNRDKAFARLRSEFPTWEDMVDAPTRKIARAIRHSSGGMRFVKALGLSVDGRAQVSMNLTNFKKTPLPRVVEAIRREAERYGVGIHNSELVGLIPQQALVDAAVWYTQMDLFSPDQVLERKMAMVVGASSQPDFTDDLAAATPTPGGGAAAAYAGAMGAALVSMVANLTIGKKGYQDQEKTMKNVLKESETLRAELLVAVDSDSEAFDQVMAAYRMPKSDPDRKGAIQDATLGAALVPLAVAEKSLLVMGLALEAARSGNLNAISDAGSAVHLAFASLTSAAYNVRINLSGLDDKKKAGKLKQAIEEIEKQAWKSQDAVKDILKDRGDLF